MRSNYKQVQINITKELYEEIKQAKNRKQCITVAECIRKAIIEFLQRD